MEKAAKQTKQLSEEITELLLDEIVNGIYKEEKRLPTEKVLAEKFGVSRNLIRDCLSILDREGFISRKHGVGSIINRYVADTKIRLDLLAEFMDLVKMAGFTPKVEKVDIETIICDKTLSGKLNIEEGEKVYKIFKAVSADGKHAIMCFDYIAHRYVTDDNYTLEDLKNPVFNFLEKNCHKKVYMSMSDINAKITDDEQARIFGIPRGTALLFLGEVGYDLFGNPCLYSEVFHVDGVLQMKILRKKI